MIVRFVKNTEGIEVQNGASITLNFKVGMRGADGEQGADGQGVPIGGSIGQVLAKKSSTDFDTEWVDQQGGGTVDAYTKAESDNKFATITNLQSVANQVGTNTSDIAGLEDNKQDKTDNGLNTVNKTVVGAINEVDAKVLGIAHALVFATKLALDTWLATPANKASLVNGQNLYIIDLGTPDYWWDYAAQIYHELECKTDLTNYYTKSEIDNFLAGKQDKINFVTNSIHQFLRDDGVMSYVDGIVEYAICQEQIFKGDPISITAGSNSTQLFIRRAKADDPTRMPAAAIALDAGNGGDAIRIVEIGVIGGINTGSYQPNTALYVKNGGGTTSNIAETTIKQQVAVVERSGGSDGVVLVGIQAIDDAVHYTNNTANVDLGQYKLIARGINFPNAAVSSPVSGDLYYDPTDFTLVFVGYDGTTLSIGEEMYVPIVNKTGAQINDGQACYINGAQGNRATANIANSANISASAVIGIATQNIADNGDGKLTTFGVVHGFNTQGMIDGGSIWLNGTTISQTKPTSGYIIHLGYALNSTVNGSIFVNPSRPLALGLDSNSDEIAPTVKAVKAAVDAKQDILTFSTDIEADKTSTTKISAIKTFYDWAVGKFTTTAAVASQITTALIGYITATSTNTLTNKTLNDSTNYIDADALHVAAFCDLGSAATILIPIYFDVWNTGSNAVTVKKAANGGARCDGLMESAGNDGTVQSVRTSGLIIGTAGAPVNTSTWSAGTVLYVDGIGTLTATKPTTLPQAIGKVLRQHATLGVVNVDIQEVEEQADDLELRNRRGIIEIVDNFRTTTALQPSFRQAIASGTATARADGLQVISSSSSANSGYRYDVITGSNLNGTSQTLCKEYDFVGSFTIFTATLARIGMSSTSITEEIRPMWCFKITATGTIVAQTVSNGGSLTTANLTGLTTLVTGTIYHFRITPTAANVKFDVYDTAGALLGTVIIATNVPTSFGSSNMLGFQIVDTTGGTREIARAYHSCAKLNSLGYGALN